VIKIRIGQKMKKDGAVVVLLNEKRETLILLRPGAAKWSPNTWGFPGGRIEAGEDPETAATRETMEETQLEVRDLKLADLKLPMPVFAYYTRDFSGEVTIDYEHDDWAWASRDKIETYPLAPQVLELFEWVLAHE
jgi:8-oxo-dGTP pyrophosphatase MutT (NUDIX family)